MVAWRRACLVAGVASLAAASGAYAFGAFGTPPLSTSTGSAHYWIEVLDFNGDTDGDLVVADYDDDEIEAYPGNGDGSFGAPQSIALPNGSGPNGIAVGEFVGDNSRDLAVTNYDGNSISILRGTGSGFDLERTFDSRSVGPYPVVAEDIDRDGTTDLAVGNVNPDHPTGSPGFGVYVGKGDGKFEAPKAELGSAVNAYGLALARLNGDNKIDALVVDAGRGWVVAMLGYRRGQFRTESIATTGTTDLAYDPLATGDFNGNNKEDAVVAHVNKFVLLRGKGDGTFKAPQSFPAAGAGVDGMEAADVNEDGDLDVVLANASGISVGLGNGNGDFAALAPYGGGLAAPVFLGSGRLNSDEGIDLVRGAETGYDIYLNLDN